MESRQGVGVSRAAYQREWRKKNPERVKEYERRRKEKKGRRVQGEVKAS